MFVAWLKKAEAFVFTLTGILLAAGLIAVIANLTWCYFPVVFFGDPLDPNSHLLARISRWCLGGGAVTGLIAFVLLQGAPKDESPQDKSKRMFGRCLVGIGFVLLLDTLINVVAVAGFAKAGAMEFLFRPGSAMLIAQSNAVTSARSNHMHETGETNLPSANLDLAKAITIPRVVGTNEVALLSDADAASVRWMQLTPTQKNLVTALQMLFAMGFSIMGALFFFATSLWEKMRANPPEQFDERIFWAGLWFRLGESVLFTLVIFVALLFNRQTEVAGWMPFIALIIGLNVKSAENLIAGISKRTLNAINAFIG